jgi:hypothetical protein
VEKQMVEIAEVTLFELFQTHRRLDFDTFIFLKISPTWSRTETALLGAEEVYDDCEETDCGTPDWIFEKGFCAAFVSSDINHVFGTWIENGGADTYENFQLCMSNFLTNDALTFP